MSLSQNRLLSIDVLRGLTIAAMIIVNTPGSWSHVYAPLLHAKWHGCTPTDLVFPFFLFVVGLSMAFSYSKYDGSNRSQWLVKAMKRTALIFIVGLLLNWFPFFHKNISELRIFGVLQRIALAFGGAAILILFSRKRMLLVQASVIILLGYWALMYFGGGVDPYSLEGNLATSFDIAIAGESHVYGGFGIPFDPEGIISTIPCIAHVIIGYLIGGLTVQLKNDLPQLVKKLLVIGVVLVGAGLLWDIFFPINKPIWTSSYVLYTIGLGTILFSAIIYMLDIKKITKWAFPFRVFGINPLISYVLSGLFVKMMYHIFNWEGGNLYGWTYTNVFQNLLSPKFGSFLQALLYMSFIWLFAYALYKKGKVIKL